MRRGSKQLAEKRIEARLKAINRTSLQDMCDVVKCEETIFIRSLREKSRKLLDENNKRLLRSTGRCQKTSAMANLTRNLSWGNSFTYEKMCSYRSFCFIPR